MKSVKILESFGKLKICESVATVFLFFSVKSVGKPTNKLIISKLQFFSSAKSRLLPPKAAKNRHFPTETATLCHFPTIVKILAGGYMKNRQKPTLFYGNS